MATLNEIAYNIKELAYGGHALEGSQLPIRLIKNWVNYHRAALLREYYADGKNVHPSSLQEWEPTKTDSLLYNLSTASQTYWDAATDNDNELLVNSNVYHNAAQLSSRARSLKDMYGRSSYDFKSKMNKDSYGFIIVNMPEILSLNGEYAVKELSLRTAQDEDSFNSEGVLLPILSASEQLYRKFKRFGSKDMPCGSISRKASDKLELSIGLLRSNLKNQTDGFGDPIQYRVSLKALFSNPTTLPVYNGDDSPYPFPEELIPMLVERIIAREVTVISGTKADRTIDGADDEKQTAVR
jgi:hypothetical protein